MNDPHGDFMREAAVNALPEGRGGRNERVANLFQKFSPYIRIVLRQRRTVPAADVDDLTQEVFLRLLRYGDDTAIEHPVSYLIRVAANVANEWGERARLKLPHDDSMLAELPCDAHDEPEHAAVRAERSRRVKAAVGELTPRRREVLLLHIDDGLTMKQIAQHRRLTHRVVVRELYRTYRALRLRLKAEEL